MKKFFTVFLFIIVITVFAFIIWLVNSGQVKVDYYHASVDIDEAGNIDVVETMVVKYPNGYNWRLYDIGYGKDHKNNPLTEQLNYFSDVADLEKSNIKVTVLGNEGNDITNQMRIGYSFNNDTYFSQDSGTEKVQCYENNGYCESILVDATEHGGFEKQTTFIYEYTINHAVTQYSDVSELNWNMFTYMEATVKKAEVVVTLPDNSHEVNDIRAYGHGLSNGNIKINKNDEIIYTAKKVKTNESFEIRVVIPNDVLPFVNENNKINVQLEDKIVNYETELAIETNRKYTVALIINILTIILFLFMVFIFIKVYKKYDKEYVSSFDGSYYRELPYSYTPAEMSYLYYMKKTNTEDVTATLLDLIRRKYLLLDTEGEEISSDEANFKVSLNPEKSLDGLLPHELHLIDWFIKTIGNGETVSLDEIEKYGKKSYIKAQKFEEMGKKFSLKVKESASKYDFFEDAAKIARSKAGALGLIPIVFSFLCIILGALFDVVATFNFIVGFALAIIFYIYLASIKKRSVNGNLEFSKWKAFANFLKDFSTMEDYPMPGLIIWEEYLVYATSLKLADKVMKQLKVKLPESEYETSGATYMSSRYYHRGMYFGSCFNRIGQSVTTAKTNSISTIQAHNSSSGGGHGGGFSGGSSFGGGGGGGRSGR